MDPQICIANIGPLQRRRRRNFGLVALGLAVAATLVALRLDAGLLVRLAITPLVFGGLLGLLQSKGHT